MKIWCVPTFLGYEESLYLPITLYQLDSTSFKQIHAAVLSLAARSLNRQRWNVSVSAANDTEQTESQIAVRGPCFPPLL